MSSTTRTDETPTATTDHSTAHVVPAVPESTDPTAATTARTETEDKLWEALRANPNSTAADLSIDASIVRSTAAKILARWANDGSVTRTAGIAEGGRRAADLWSITDPEAPSAATLEAVYLEHAADADENSATTPSDTRTQTTDTDETVAEGDAPDEVTADAEPDIPEPTGEGKDTSEDGRQKMRRLPPGGLRGLVEDWLREHPGEEFSPEVGEFANSEASTDGNRRADGQNTGTESRELGNRSGVSSKVSGTKPRRGKGELRSLVLDVLREQVGAEVLPVEIGRALDASPGAVVNACKWLVCDGQVRLASARPRRYSVVADSCGASS